MPSNPDNPYHALKADARLEVRIPAVLKQQAERVAAARQQKVSEFVFEAVADAVTEGMAELGAWTLSVPEQQELLQILARPATQTPGMTAARERAEQLFGPATLD